MSGRGRSSGRSRGFAGRGGRGFTNSGGGSKTAPKASKKTLSDSIYYLGSAKQAADFETTTEFLINHIKKTFNFGNDIGTELETYEEFDLSKYRPTLKVSNDQDEAKRESENKQYEIEFKAEFDAFMKRKQSLETNKTKAYAFLWEQCSKAMQNKIEARSNYDKVDTDNIMIKGHPIHLLKAIKEHALSYQEHRYEMSILLDSLRGVLNLKQKDGESLQDYTKRFKTARDVLVSHIGGPIVFTKYVSNMPGYDKNDSEKSSSCVKKAWDQFLAFTYLDNSDKAKYGTLLTGLQTQQSLKNNQYPKSITEANNVLSNHRFDIASNMGKGKSDRSQKENEKELSTQKEEAPEMSFAMLEGKCYCCGKPNHKSPECRMKDKIPKEEWAINKAKSKEQSHATVSQIPVPNNNTREPTSSTGWSAAHIQFYQAEEMKELILLDNGSTVNLFCNPNLVENITDSNETLHLSTNGGDLHTNQRATVPKYGEVWFDPTAITNIFSFAEMENRYRITYDSSKEKAFVVHLPDKQIKFSRTDNGLYAYKPNYTTKNHASLVNHSLESVEENKKLYAPRQVQRAKMVRHLYHALGTPSLSDFKAIIKMNVIKNLPITLEDVNIAEQIFGTDIGALKGKTTRQKPAPVVSDYIAIPPEILDTHQDIVLCMDGMKVNGIPFLTTISKNIMYRTAEWVPNQTAAAYRSVLNNVFRMYNRAGFRITTIRCDNEFRPLMDELQDVYQVKMNYANPQEHVPEAERNHRVIKERIRAAFHRLPFKKLPKIMIKILTMESAKKLNFFCPKGGVSQYYSPRMILHQRNLDYEKHCSIAFGSYVQAHDEPTHKNDQHPRTLDCIYLRYVDSDQSGHNLLDLRTGRTINRRTVTTVPITQNIIDLVHAMADQDKMSDGLKIETRSGRIIYDSSWIAGVEYENDDETNDKNDNIDSNDDESEIEYDEMDPNDLAEILQDKNQSQENDQNPNEEHNDGGEENLNFQEANLEEANDDDDHNFANDHNIEEYNSQNEEQSNPSGEEEEEEEEKEVEEVDYDRRLYDYDTTRTAQTTRSGRVSKAPERLGFNQYHLFTQGCQQTEYTAETAKVIAKVINHLNNMILAKNKKSQYAFVISYSLKKGLKHFGERGYNATLGEVKQLHDRVVFRPVHISDLTPIEKKRALESLIFLVEKKDGRVKARYCANGSTQRSYIAKEDAASPTAASESHLLTAVIDAKEERDVMSADIPNAFVQTEMETNGKDRVIMKIRGVLVDMLVALNPELYQPFVVIEEGEKVLYVELLKALYGTLQAAIFFYKKFRKDLESQGFKINPYDPCVANRMVNGHQHTVTWHVDDLKSSHKDPKVNDDFLKWLNDMYGDPKIAPVKATRGKVHEYLAMKLDFTTPGKLKVDMKDYVKGMIEEFPEQIENSSYPWNDNLFKVDEKASKLSKQKHEIFHTFVAKGLFLCKRGRPDVQPAIAFFTTRVKSPDEGDWFKLKKMMGFLKKTQDDVLTLHADESGTITWYLDAAFAVHRDCKSHTGAIMTLGAGALQSVSTKHKTNSRSSTEAELVSIDDILSKILWTKLFLQAQGFDVKENILLRDNQSSMKLEMNGKASSGKRTRHFNIKYFYITDLIERKEVSIKFCPTETMVADYMTKPLSGSKFHAFRKLIMN